ncbi:MAG: hypothetical protein WC114_01595 [Smithellaceae bacterium]
MKRWTTAICLIAIALCVSGCASLVYESPDGTRVTYNRFMTGADAIKGQVPGATIESTGQKAIDPAALEALVRILSTAN